MFSHAYEKLALAFVIVLILPFADYFILLHLLSHLPYTDNLWYLCSHFVFP